MSECCKELFLTLEKYELDDPQFTKDDTLTVVTYILSWQQRQCRCVFKDQLNLSRLEDQLQILLSYAIENISSWTLEPRDRTNGEPWSDIDKEKLFLAVSKIFQIHFPFYQARQIPLVRQDITAKDCSKYCDMSVGEVAEALLINIAYFCENGGLVAIREAFQGTGEKTLPFQIAHLLISIVSQLRVWFSVQAIVQYIVPLRGPVIRYLCQLSDKELRQQDGWAMADSMWNGVKGPSESMPIFDSFTIDSLDLAFKYFTSSTLTVRLAGLSQIANQVHMFMDIYQANTVGEASNIGAELSQWLVDNNIIEHLFGPNLHVELLKQSQIILNYLAHENCITNQHLDCIWAAAQLKHASRYVHDLLTVLTKQLHMPCICYLLALLSKLHPSMHTKQTLFLASLLLRIYWSSGLSSDVQGPAVGHVSSPVQGPISASATTAAVAAAMQRKFRQNRGSMSQSSSRSNSLSEISIDGDQRDMEEPSSPRKFTDLPPQDLEMEEVNCEGEESALPPDFDNPNVDYPNLDKGEEDADIDSNSCTNSHASSLSETRDLDDFDDVEDELTQLKAVAALRNIQNSTGEDMKGFDLNTVCDKGETLLWDLLQDENAIHLEDGLVQEAEKLLCQLICYTGKKKIRMKFVEGCVANLANNRSVVMSLQLLPKLFSSFQQYVNTSSGPYWVKKWATSELGIMELFFKNLVLYMDNSANRSTSSCSLYSHKEEVQARLQFLSSIFSNELSKPEIGEWSGLSLDQVDVLWSALVNDCQCSDEALEWFVQQAQSKDLHALNNQALNYIFTEKLPSIAPETFTMTGLTLLQQLHKMFENSVSLVVKAENTSQVYGIDQLWNVALQAKSLEVSMAAINYLNSSYINDIPTASGFLLPSITKTKDDGGSLKSEEEFITRCMSSIREAAKPNYFLETKELSLQIMKRGITLLKSHIEMFKKRFAFHLRLWLLEGHGITCHRQKVQHTTEKHFPIRVMCQPAGLSDKGTFEMHSSDLVAELRAEVSHWCKQLQEKIKNQQQGEDTSTRHIPLSPFSPQLHPPFRLISQGHELTPDLDEKTLADVGFKDLQLVFVSVGAMRRDLNHDNSQIPSSSLPAPKWDNAPMMILLQDKHFDELFSFLEILDKLNVTNEKETSEVKNEGKLGQQKVMDSSNTPGSSSDSKMKEQRLPMDLTEDLAQPPLEEKSQLQRESYAQHLCQLIWELLCILPTNPSVLTRLKYFGRHLTPESDSKKTDTEQKHSYEEFSVPWMDLLDPHYPHKLLYCLQVVDLIHYSYEDRHQSLAHDSKSSSESSDSSDTEEENTKSSSSSSWGSLFVEFGGLRHLYNIVMSGQVETRCGQLWTPWQEECLAYLLKLVYEFGTIKADDDEDEVFSMSDSEQNVQHFQQRDGRFRVRYKSTEKEETICIKCLSPQLMSMVEVEPLLNQLLSLSYQSTLQVHTGPHRGGRGGQVVHHAISLLVSWAYTDSRVSKSLLHQKNFRAWLKQLVLLAREPMVRCEACRGLYRLSLIKEDPCLIELMDALLDFLPLAQSLQSKGTSNPSTGHGKNLEPCAQEYFAILCRLVDSLPIDEGNKDLAIDLNSLANLLSEYIIKSNASSKRHSNREEEEGLCGMLKLYTAVMRHNPPFKYSDKGLEFLRDIFGPCLFDLPSDCYDDRNLPLCKLRSARSAAYDLLLEMAKESKENFLELQKLLMKHHRPGNSRLQGSNKKHSSYGWHYWPHDNERAPCGLVGIINLGATCYMASCIQQLFMMPEAKASILNAKMTGNARHDHFLKELQKMFCFLMMSERKAHNPRSFCRTYTMDKQLINTGEQKDMTEFFTDLISKLEDMSPSLRDLVRELFCGVITNNVVSLDCTHVSKTKEEFYSVRCTVADMKNLYESLDEVTIKDTLDGDNMYTCSQCCKKVRAEKRACFTVLPKILCFNTMRYTFNMVTMMKEKVNTHFSFPLQLNMAPYSEEYLMGDKANQDPEKDPNYWYNLIGVVVHTGTAEGGHYYSFIRNRTDPKQDQWFLFNDAEVKPFDPSQIASECFGGEMTTKTYDVVSEKFMELSFEKTHSAYMLFYERHTPNAPPIQVPPINLSPDLANWIWTDNIQFLHDKHIFDTTYFNFLWLLCSSIPPTLEDSEEAVLSNIQLSTSFLLETLVHSKEKLLLKNWSELLITHLENSSAACEWFLNTLSVDDWWLQQMFIKCPVQSIRHMFARLCIHAIQALRPSYVQSDDEDAEAEDVDKGPFSFVVRFIKAVLKLLDLNHIRLYIKNLSEFFWFLHQFALVGQEEREFLIGIEAISTMIHFYLKTKTPEVPTESSADDDDDMDDDDDEVVALLPEDKYRGSSLEKMVSLIAVLVEASWSERQLNLSKNDIDALVGGKEIKGLTFLFQVIKDNVNLRHTANLVLSLCRYNTKLAENVVSMLISSVQKLPSEQSQAFFKLLSMLTELQGGPPGLPSFINLTLARIWEAAEYNAMLCLDWLTLIAPKNKMAHQWVLDNMNKWVEKYLIADNNPRIRNASACLLVSLVPSHSFRLSFRTRSFTTPQKDLQLSEECKSVLHKIYKALLELLSPARNYCDRTMQGTTKLVSYFAVLNYFLVSRSEKEMLRQYLPDLWRLFHPIMSEPNISVHHNKQALLIFWYHACQDCESNVAFITETPQVASNIALNYILSSDEPEVINFNRNVLPAYYGLLRLCCEYSCRFTRQLATHSNMRWAFEHLTSRVNHYPQAIEELFALMRLFSGQGHPNLTAEDKAAAAAFRKSTIMLYLNCLDGVSHWTTLITAFKILLQTEEDRLIVLVNQGLLTLSDAITTLHLMYHEATACHVTGDLKEVLNLLKEVLQSSQSHMENAEVRSSILGWSDKMEITQKLLSLLNSYTPKDLHTSCLDVLRAILSQYPSECVELLIPMIHQSHNKWHQSNQQPTLGPYFPRRHNKVIVSSKALPRPSVPELNMFLHPSYLETPKGVDEAYDKAMSSYFHPYHSFVDKLVRVGFNQERVSDTCINLSCLLAIEAIPLHFHFFSKLWMDVYQKSGEHVKYKDCIQRLCQRPEFIEYIDSILLEERECLNVQEIYSFLCCLFPRVHTIVLKNQWKTLVHTLVAAVIADQPAAARANDEELLQIARRITADLRAMSLMFSVSSPKKSDISNLLLPSLEDLLSICKKHQSRKQKRLKARQSSLEESPEDDTSDENGTETSEAPLKKKRRKTHDGDDEGAKPEKPAPSEIPGTSGESSKPAKHDGSSEVPQRPKLHPLLGSRPTLDWVDHLAKAVQTAISKVPK